MGIMDCPVHGLQGFYYGIERDIAINIRASIPVDPATLIVIDIFYYMDGELFYTRSLLLNKSTYAQWNLEKQYKVFTEDEDTALMALLDQNINLTGVCGACYREYKARYNWPIIYPTPW